MTYKIFVNGYGSIGSRIASFLMDDPELVVIGVGKQSPDMQSIKKAKGVGLKVYVPARKLDQFDGMPNIAGTIESALDKADLVVDASPGGCGYINKVELYEPYNVPAIYQGGETILGSKAVSDVIFNSRTNYDAVSRHKHIMQGSCNVTGMGRILEPLYHRYSTQIARIDVTLIRRWADIDQINTSVPDTIQMTQSPHHGDDLKATMSTNCIAPLFVRAIKVPTRQMHLHIMDIRFTDSAATPPPSQIHDTLANEPGVATLWTAKDTAAIRKCALEMQFHFADTNMVHIHANMTTRIGDTIQMMYSDDQTGIVVPENHMLIQAMLSNKPYKKAVAHTESIFHMAEKKRILQEKFAKV